MAAPGTPEGRVVVVWGGEVVETQVLRTTGERPAVLLHLALPADPEVPDADGPVEFVVHLSELLVSAPDAASAAGVPARRDAARLASA
jgi:hypothetical protein